MDSGRTEPVDTSNIARTVLQQDGEAFEDWESLLANNDEDNPQLELPVDASDAQIEEEITKYCVRLLDNKIRYGMCIRNVS